MDTQHSSPHLDVRELIRLHFQLECVGIDGRGDLIPIPCPNPDGVPRVYAAQHADADRISVFFRHNLPRHIREQLIGLPSTALLYRHETVKAILAHHQPCEQLHFGKSYICPQRFPPSAYPYVVRLDERHRAMIQAYDQRIDPSRTAIFAVILEGKIVCTCESARENDTAAEAWVRTLTDYRRRGFARQTTAAWVNHILAEDKMPFYSHRMDNLASEAVARSLNLMQFITDAAYQ